MWILLGLVLGALFATFARAGGPLRERRILAVGLLLAALVYVGFALLGGAPARWLAAEFAGVTVFGMAAAAGVRFSGWFLALGWGAHVLWDVLLHRSGGGSTFTPGAYPLLCVGFDLVVAAWVAVRQVRRSGPAQPSPGPAA